MVGLMKTCEGSRTRDIRCLPAQVIKITKANYGGPNEDLWLQLQVRHYNCRLPPALCHMKRMRDGRSSCEMNVMTKEFNHDACPSMKKLKKYLYIE